MMLFFITLVLICPYSFAQDNTSETVIVNAAFENVAPCPCDLKFGSCDIGCCCDGDCSADEQKTFSACIPFLPGGQTAQTQQYKCSSNHYNKVDWFPFLCIVFEYNAFLGYYYDWQYKMANNTQIFLNKLYTAVFYWYREQENRFLSENSPQGYIYGISIKTRKTNITIGNSGTLSLPQPTLNGQCLNTAPVRYLINLDTSCSLKLTEALCSNLSLLSAFHYIQDSKGEGVFSVLEEESSNIIAETNVIYKCTDNVQKYVTSSTVLSNIVRNNISYTFSNTLPSPSCMDQCGNDICIDLNNLTNPDIPTKELQNCSSQVIPSPSFNNYICSNAVIDVSYKIRWVGNKVAKVDATVVLGNLSVPLLNATQTEVTQKFKATFVHNITSVGNDSIDNFNNITNVPYERSGRLGYNFGKMVYSGSLVTNKSVTPATFLYVNTNSTRQMAVIDTTADGLCVNAKRRTITFGDNMSTSCRLMLKMEEFKNCSQLRKLIINWLNALMPSDVLGRRGYNDEKNREYWINVLKEDLSETCLLSEYFPLHLSPVDQRTGVCYNITNGINLNILYGETGKSNGYFIYEILGSRISYSNTTWQMTCGGPLGKACTGTDTQAFYVTSSVKFTRIPAQTPTPVPKYFQKPEEDDKELCPGDRCWDNLFYPFSRRYHSESREYVFGMVSLAIIFFVGYLLVSRPWW